MVKSKMSPRSGYGALRQLNPSIKRGHKVFFLKTLITLYQIETFGAVWYHLYNLQNVNNTRGEMMLLVKLKGEVCNFTKIKHS